MLERTISALARLPSLHRVWPEVILVPCSLCAWHALLSAPATHETFPVGFHLALEIADQRQWGWIVGIGAVAKVLGLLLCLIPPLRLPGQICRTAGLSVSGAFWFIAGLGTLLANPEGLFGACGVVLGVSAWLQILCIAAEDAR